ncbi:MAG: TetR/AcrR family transcriptional regulator [Gammaproteobacteria bacterium]|nr:TetR/AcrR family transcriptional regulator [Gammaproteobacteria bacterium]MDH5653953.1 TetR/AcrR family transcriptional regulator [Gammaproteobacteria bacterium]
MTTKTSAQDIDQVRETILLAAEQRLRTFGYGKTTMAEIATDAGMSAANLYRYFDSKLDIGAALALHCFENRNTLLQQVVQRTDLTPPEKLQAFVIACLHYTHTEFSEAPKVNELVDIIVAERPDLIQVKIENDLKLIRAILTDGINSGEFAIDDLAVTAQAIQNAVVKFNVPLFITMHPLAEFEQHARALVDLLVRGLASKQD